MTDEIAIGRVIAEQTQKVMYEQNVAWERVLRLHIKPRPRWCPEWAWKRALGAILIQSEQVVR